jgi:hypothetical protein
MMRRGLLKGIVWYIIIATFVGLAIKLLLMMFDIGGGRNG